MCVHIYLYVYLLIFVKKLIMSSTLECNLTEKKHSYHFVYPMLHALLQTQNNMLCELK